MVNYIKKEKQKSIDKETIDFAHSRTLYMLGLLQGMGEIDARVIDDMDELTDLCSNIANDWINMVDIQNKEEEGYPQPYAERRLLEFFNSIP